MKQSKMKLHFPRKMKDKVVIWITLLMLTVFNSSITASAAVAGNKIADSDIGKGLVNMFNDLSLFLLILSPLVGLVFAIYFLIRKNGADEQDQKQWNKRLFITGICVVGAVCAFSIINLLTGYFKPAENTTGSKSASNISITTTKI